MKFKRICLMVLDSAGIGEMPDASDWGDAGADTLGNILKSRKVDLPNLQRLGLGNIRALEGISPAVQPIGSYGKCALKSNGKDTTTGHWRSEERRVGKAGRTRTVTGQLEDTAR